MRRALALALSLTPLALVACGARPSTPTVALRPATPPADAAALDAAVEAFYAASDVAGLRAAVAAAKAAGPHAARAHALAARLAELEDRPRDELQHHLEQLRDPMGDTGLRALSRLADLDWTLTERAQVEAVLRAVRADHPDPKVRAMAAWMSAHASHLRGDAPARDAALEELGFRPALALVGTWDNDQGKGFDQAHGPERTLDLGAQYDGSLVQIGWRTDYPMDPRGKVDLGRLMYPVEWQVAYAATGVQAKEAGPYELRLSTSDPVKIWVNDRLVFEGHRVSRWLFDGVTVPVTLRAGQNRVLIKTGNRGGSGWLLAARITAPGGAPITDDRLVATAADLPYATGAEPGDLTTEADLVAQRLPTGTADSARVAQARIEWARDLGLEVLAVEAAEAFLKAHPQSLNARFQYALALWDNQERGRTADLLNALEQAFGDALPLVALKQARFWLQQKLIEKARALLVKVRTAHPDRPSATRMLADLFGREKWHEDRCALLAELDAGTPDWPDVQFELADCRKRLHLYPEAEAIYRRVLEALPLDPQALDNLQWLVLGNQRFAESEALAAASAKGWPHRETGWVRLGETRRRAGDIKGAAEAWRQLVRLSPINPSGYARLARLWMQTGDTGGAVEQFRAALSRDPENERISHRLDYLAPEKTGPWAADVPNDAALDAAVARRAQVTPGEGANVIYLMDDEVTVLGGDGSTINFVTMVAHAVNQAGRDQLTRMSVRRGGRHRILHAYGVDPQGERVEASSIRGNTVRFRKLTVGSTVVLQYRIDERPDGFLASHLARQWWFQAPGAHTDRGRWVLYTLPGETLLQEQLRVQHTQRTVGELVRHEWSAQDVQPIIAEPGMPPYSEVAAHVVVSTVPDWNTFWSWERELLRDAFRESPELIALAKGLLAGAQTPQEKVDRIHAYLMTNIRYQQDYEKQIAGVKPHAAPVVVARQYGDCKDKAVLFITLARLAGIDVHFALVRTRDSGPVRRGVPMQQFNHAIVYVPAQEGLPEGRFYDPTVDALDVQVLRHDDQGTWSLVFDPRGGAHTWRQIPFQDPGVDDVLNDLVLSVDGQGQTTGELELVARGRLGAFLRQGARNKRQLEQALEQQVGHTFPGGRVLSLALTQVTDVFQPARVRLALTSSGLVRKEGDELRFKLPAGWTPEGWFRLSQRQHPLLLGSPRTLRWAIDISLPKEAEVRRLPASGVIDSDCVRLTREVSRTKTGLKATQSVVMKCERMTPAQYATHRVIADKMTALLDEEVVLRVRPSKGR